MLDELVFDKSEKSFMLPPMIERRLVSELLNTREREKSGEPNS